MDHATKVILVRIILIQTVQIINARLVHLPVLPVLHFQIALPVLSIIISTTINALLIVLIPPIHQMQHVYHALFLALPALPQQFASLVFLRSTYIIILVLMLLLVHLKPTQMLQISNAHLAYYSVPHA
jgi:hypothetical protein